jgi:hypothetical protein
VRAATPIRIDPPSEQLGGRWNFYRIFESFDLGVNECGRYESRAELVGQRDL